MAAIGAHFVLFSIKARNVIDTNLRLVETFQALEPIQFSPPLFLKGQIWPSIIWLK